MKKIIIKSLTLTNFKGKRSLIATFRNRLSTVSGANGTGKTTLFDAFTWLLFGKDSQDRKTFDIKTLGEDGRAIERIPHEVEARLDVDGKELRLTRRYSEKWTKRRGQADEEMTGHEETRLWNDVPMSVKDWAAKIDDLCSESIFKRITNPAFFASQKMEDQRAMLMEMAGNVDDAEVAHGDKDFEALIKEMEDKTLDEMRKEVAAKKRRVKAEVDGIPARIDELERTLASYGDADRVQAEARQKETEQKIAEVDAEAQSAAEAVRAILKKSEEVNATRQELTRQMVAREKALTDKALAGWRAQIEANGQVKAQVAELRAQMAQKEAERSALCQRQQTLLSALDALRSEWRAINAETLTLDPQAFVCPTCHRPLEAEDIEEKQAQMTASFNATKANRLEQNQTTGKQTKQECEAVGTQIADADHILGSLSKKVQELEATLTAEPAMPDTQTVAMDDAEWQSLLQRRTELDNALVALGSEQKTDERDEERKARRAALVAERDEAVAEIGKAKEAERTKARMEQLTADMKAGAQALADLERKEFVMASFIKARISMVEDQINALFPTVRFRLFKEQINGGEVETCEATVGGVPYGSLNHAGQVLAGLEIISAICHHAQVSAPIFVDNAEAVNAFPPMESQMILLKVTEDQNLIIC